MGRVMRGQMLDGCLALSVSRCVTGAGSSEGGMSPSRFGMIFLGSCGGSVGGEGIVRGTGCMVLGTANFSAAISISCFA